MIILRDLGQLFLARVGAHGNFLCHRGHLFLHRRSGGFNRRRDRRLRRLFGDRSRFLLAAEEEKRDRAEEQRDAGADADSHR
jgi:hypothetical protein